MTITYNQMEDYIRKSELLKAKKDSLTRADYYQLQKSLSKELRQLTEHKPSVKRSNSSFDRYENIYGI